MEELREKLSAFRTQSGAKNAFHLWRKETRMSSTATKRAVTLDVPILNKNDVIKSGGTNTQFLAQQKDLQY